MAAQGQSPVPVLRCPVASLPSPSTSGHPNAAGAPCSVRTDEVFRRWAELSLNYSQVPLYQVKNPQNSSNSEPTGKVEKNANTVCHWGDSRLVGRGAALNPVADCQGSAEVVL